PRDHRELVFERRRNRSAHRLRIRPRELRRDEERRKVDVGEIADGKGAIRDHAEQGDGRHEQAGRNRPPDESFRDIHLLLLAGPHPRSFSLGFAARPSSASLGPQALPPDLHDPPDSFLPAAPPAASTTAWPRRTFCLLLHAAAGLETKLAFRDDRL